MSEVKVSSLSCVGVIGEDGLPAMELGSQALCLLQFIKPRCEQHRGSDPLGKRGAETQHRRDSCSFAVLPPPRSWLCCNSAFDCASNPFLDSSEEGKDFFDLGFEGTEQIFGFAPQKKAKKEKESVASGYYGDDPSVLYPNSALQFTLPGSTGFVPSSK
ncbi:hypothetical protein Q9966_004367 [Columba livia]|nr:hypothetical protein Q9966_004367 [Columba livia]